MDFRRDLFQIIESGIDSVRPEILFPGILKKPFPELAEWISAKDRFLLSIGKASLPSARTILSFCDCREYFVLAPAGGVSTDLDPARVHRGSHPIPDQRSLDAAENLISWIRGLHPSGRLLVVLSGGTSALLVLPAAGISLPSKMKINELLLRSGATIQEMNAVRKHLSAVKGGQLGRLVTHLNPLVLVISDVIGDDLSTIGSGPFYPDPTTFETAESVLKKYDIWELAPAEVKQRIEAGVAKSIAETPKGASSIPHRIIASNDVACARSAEVAASLGYLPRVISGVSGMVDDVAARILSLIDAAPPRSALILGGEATVQVRGSGKGGRNQHLALLIADRIRNKNVAFAAIGTDGIDGNSPAAGAWVDGDTAEKAANQGQDLRKALEQFDSFPFFQTLGQSILTGPSGTNVMDLYVALCSL